MSFTANQWPLDLTLELVELYIEEIVKNMNVTFYCAYIILRARYRDKGDE